MVAHYRLVFVIRAVSVLLLGFCMRQDALAQGMEQQGDLVYRFKLVGVADPVDAKPIQYTLLENPGMHMCVYIHEGAWFKLAPRGTWERSQARRTAHCFTTRTERPLPSSRHTTQVQVTGHQRAVHAV